MDGLWMDMECLWVVDGMLGMWMECGECGWNVGMEWKEYDIVRLMDEWNIEEYGMAGSRVKVRVSEESEGVRENEIILLPYATEAEKNSKKKKEKAK
jgi:hypothetical protein